LRDEKRARAAYQRLVSLVESGEHHTLAHINAACEALQADNALDAYYQMKLALAGAAAESMALSGILRDFQAGVPAEWD
jgi:hypothetical protein